MVKEDSYKLATYGDILKSKKKLNELISKKPYKQDGLSSMNSMNDLTKGMDAMLKLFKEASQELKVDNKEKSINKKLDEIADQNKIIAEGMVAISDMVKEMVEKKKESASLPVPEPISVSDTDSVPEPSFLSPLPKPDFQQYPQFEPSFNNPESNKPDIQLDQPPGSEQGPVIMPSIPFSEVDKITKPSRKGLFGRLKG